MDDRPPVMSGTGLAVAVAEPQNTARVTLYCLHGGGLNGNYWDCPADPSLSLVRVATDLGCRVAFPDRPGYRSNREPWPKGLPLLEEAALHAETIQGLWGREPVVLVGQSAGSMVALSTAAFHPWPGLVGVDYSGVGVDLDPGPDPADRVERFWGPRAFYPAATFERGRRPTEPTAPPDAESSQRWGGHFDEVAASVRVPVRITLADHERWWGPSVDVVLATVTAGFTASPAVMPEVAFGAGHNLSLGFAGRPYHLRAVAFADDCVRRAAGMSTSARTRGD